MSKFNEISINLSQLSPFDQAMKEFGEVLYSDTNIREGKKTALNILLGQLTFASKIPKNESATLLGVA